MQIHCSLTVPDKVTFYNSISSPHFVKLKLTYENPPSSDSDPGPGGDMALSSELGPVITRLQLYGLMTPSLTQATGFLLEKMTWISRYHDVLLRYYSLKLHTPNKYIGLINIAQNLTFESHTE